MNRQVAGHHTTRLALHRIGAHILLDRMHTLDHDMVGIHTSRHFAAATLVAASNDNHFVIFANLVHHKSFFDSSEQGSKNLRRQRHDLHEALSAQFTRHRAENARTNGLEFGIKQHGRIAIELDQGAVRTTDTLGGTHHDGTVNLTLFHATARGSFFDADLDDVAHAGVAALGAAQHLDAHDGFGARIVGDIQSGLRLNHVISFTQLSRKKMRQSWLPGAGIDLCCSVFVQQPPCANLQHH